MKFVFLSYVKTPGFTRPEDWISRISGYTGVLEALANRHTVVSIEQIHYEGVFLYNGVEYHFLDSKGKLNFPWRLHQHVKNERPDIVVVHGMHLPLQLIQLKLFLGSTAIIIVQNHAEKPGHTYKKILQKMADSSVNAYLFASKEMGMEWVKQGIISRSEKIREVMEASCFFSPLDKTSAKTYTGVSGSPVFLWVGRLNQNKDPLTVVKAFLTYAHPRPATRLYMIFHSRELISEIQALLDNAGKDRDAVILVGEKKYEDMLHWYNAADFILSGSHYEGSGVAVCEAMACGCIPVLTNIPSFRTITGNGDCGILYAAGNEKALVAALAEISRIDTGKERDKVITQFKKQLSFEAIARGIDEVASSL